jgi:hypothetical protein
MQFCEWLRHPHNELFQRNTTSADKACFMCKGVFNVHNSHLWARENPHPIRERGVSTLLQRQCLGWNCRAHCHGPQSADSLFNDAVGIWKLFC